MTTGKEPAEDIDAIQDRFLELWEKSKLGTLTPEESAWMLEIQEKYWTDPCSLGNLYHNM
jgi:hypothetical protein